jgi:MFS family permease
VVGFVPALGVAAVAMLVVGLSNTLLDIAGFTLLQRASPNRSRAAVFAVLAAVAGLGAASGAVVGAALADALGVTAALVVTGLLLPIAAGAGWPLTRRLDREGVVDERLAGLLRQVPPFALLPLAGLERVAAGMRAARFGTGDALMREGEAGDRFLVIESGAVVVTRAGRELARLGPGDGCGEIALLRRVRRTATVTATAPVEAWAIDSTTFLAAVGGHAGSTAVAEEIVEQRLRATPD